MSGPKTSICVSYKNTDGWHVFASDDLPGLYVAHQNAEVAYNDISDSIEKLLMLNQGIQVKAEPELSFEEFLNALKPSEDSKPQRPLVLSSQRYVVYATQ